MTEQNFNRAMATAAELGVGPAPGTGGALEYPVNAGKIPVTALPGSSYFDSAESFAMIRGGHVDVAVIVTMAHTAPSGGSKIVPECTLPLTAR